MEGFDANQNNEQNELAEDDISGFKSNKTTLGMTLVWQKMVLWDCLGCLNGFVLRLNLLYQVVGFSKKVGES